MDEFKQETPGVQTRSTSRQSGTRRARTTPGPTPSPPLQDGDGPKDSPRRVGQQLAAAARDKDVAELKNQFHQSMSLIESLATAVQALTTRLDKQSAKPPAPTPSTTATEAVREVATAMGRQTTAPPPTAEPHLDLAAILAQGAHAALHPTPATAAPPPIILTPTGAPTALPTPAQPPATEFREERLAATLLAHIRQQGYATCVRFAAEANLDGRPAHEARRMAQLIDAMLTMGMQTTDLPMEIALRALCGVIFSAVHSNPGLLEQMEWSPPGAAVPKSLAYQVIKRANRAAASAAKARGSGADKKRPGKGK